MYGMLHFGRIAKMIFAPQHTPLADPAPRLDLFSNRKILLPEGLTLPRGAVTEVAGKIGHGRTSAVLELLRRARLHEQEASQLFSWAWVEARLSLYTPTLASVGLPPTEAFFLEPSKREHALWSVQELLRSQLFSVVVWSSGLLDQRLSEVELRRLQIQAKRSGIALILLHETPSNEGRWSLTLRLMIKDYQLVTEHSERSIGSVTSSVKEEWLSA